MPRICVAIPGDVAYCYRTAGSAWKSLSAEACEIRSATPEARYCHRLGCIELMAEGYSYVRVARAFDHSPSTLVAQVPRGRGRSIA